MGGKLLDVMKFRRSSSIRKLIVMVSEKYVMRISHISYLNRPVTAINFIENN